jgi:hypothetical protein
MIDTPIMEFDQQKFDAEVAILQEKNIDYIEAILEWCEINDVELDIISTIIKKSPENKAKIAVEARKKFLLRD